MEILDILHPKCVNLNLKAKTKAEAFEEMVNMLAEAGALTNAKAALAAVREREKLMSTGIGDGVAIPHAKCNAAEHLVAAFGRTSAGINYQSLDDEPVYLIFLLVTPESESGPHVKSLARISRLLKHKFLRQSLLEAKTAQEVLDIIRDEDRRI
ncbi:MAG TPA: PTS sugar transporter subunit IIA [bacterium]|nr:PTS sugar transporter subunit IIA [bacterium]